MKTGSLKPEEIDALKDITLGDALFDDDGMEFYDSPFDQEDDGAEEDDVRFRFRDDEGQPLGTVCAGTSERAEEMAK